MDWLKRIGGWFLHFILEQMVGAILLYYLPFPVLGGVMVLIFGWLANLPWAIIGIIAVFAFLLSLFVRSLIGGLKIRFCDPNGRFIKASPRAYFWVVGTNLITYYVRGFARLSNLGLKERTIELAYISVIAKGREIIRQGLPEFHIGTRLLSFDTTKECKKFIFQRATDEYELRQLIGSNYGKAKVELVVEATAAKARIKFHNTYGTP